MKIEELTPKMVIRHPEPAEPDPQFIPMTVGVTSVTVENGMCTVYGNPVGQPSTTVGFTLPVGTDIEVITGG